MTTAPDNVRAAYQHYLQKGNPPHIAAAKAGNMWVESGGNPTIRGDGGKAFGSFQHHPDRQVRLAEFAARNGTAIDDPKTQWDFFDWELANTEKRAGDKLAASTDVKGANDAVLASLRPENYSSANPTDSAAYDARMRYSQELAGVPPSGDWISPRDPPVAAAVAGTTPGAEGLLGASGWTPAKNDALIAAGKAMLTKGQGGQAVAPAAQMPEEFRPQLAAPGLFNAFRQRAGLLGGKQ